MAYLIAGFILLIGIVLLFVFLRRRRRIDTPYSHTGLQQSSFENQIYSLGITNQNDHRSSVVNKLYMLEDGGANDINDVTEC